MNQTNLTQTIAYILQDAAAATKAGGNFILEQAPDVARQYVAYEAITSWGLVALALIACLTCVFFVKWGINNFDESKCDAKSCVALGGMIVSAFILIFGMVSLPFNAANAIKATWAPKVLLVEKASELLKGK